MRGDMVVVRGFRGEPSVVRVWDIGDAVILVCSEENYQTLVSGKKGLYPVGIPKNDVFRYNATININNPMLWEQLNSYV